MLDTLAPSTWFPLNIVLIASNFELPDSLQEVQCVHYNLFDLKKDGWWVILNSMDIIYLN